MQTIARANRVTSWKIGGIEKKNGDIIDYYNVFRNMRKAFRDYAQGQDGQEDQPVQEKGELFHAPRKCHSARVRLLCWDWASIFVFPFEEQRCFQERQHI